MFSAGQYRSTEKGNTYICYVSENIMFSNLRLTAIFFSLIHLDHFQAMKKCVKKFFESRRSGGYPDLSGSTNKKTLAFYVCRLH